MIPIPARLLLLTPTDTITATTLQDQQPAPPLEAALQDLTPIVVAMQDLPDLPTTPQVQTTAFQDLLTATQAIATQDLPAIVLPTTHTQDLLTAVLPIAAAIQDPPTAAVAVLPAEATQAPAAQDQAEAVIQEEVTQEVAHQEAHTQAAEAQEAMLLQAEDRFYNL